MMMIWQLRARSYLCWSATNTLCIAQVCRSAGAGRRLPVVAGGPAIEPARGLAPPIVQSRANAACSRGRARAVEPAGRAHFRLAGLSLINYPAINRQVSSGPPVSRFHVLAFVMDLWLKNKAFDRLHRLEKNGQDGKSAGRLPSGAGSMRASMRAIVFIR